MPSLLMFPSARCQKAARFYRQAITGVEFAEALRLGIRGTHFRRLAERNRRYALGETSTARQQRGLAG
jgi:hypothetical protein